MGLGIYERSLLLLTNASEDLITKSEAREGALHYKTYSIGQNKRSSRKPLHSGHLQTTNTGRLSQAVRYMEVPLYKHPLSAFDVVACKPAPLPKTVCLETTLCDNFNVTNFICSCT